MEDIFMKVGEFGALALITGFLLTKGVGAIKELADSNKNLADSVQKLGDLVGKLDDKVSGFDYQLKGVEMRLDKIESILKSFGGVNRENIH